MRLPEGLLAGIRRDREKLFSAVGDIDRRTVRLKTRRAEILVQNNLDGNDPELMKVNEKLHNARRCRSVMNAQREHLDFMAAYLAE